MADTIDSLKKRSDFVRLTNSGHKFVVSSFILLAAPAPENAGTESGIRFGLTVSRKMGKAVYRNRIRRRLRSAFLEVAPELAEPGHDYVLISRKNALQCSYATLIRDLRFALPRVHRNIHRKNAPPPIASAS